MSPAKVKARGRGRAQPRIRVPEVRNIGQPRLTLGLDRLDRIDRETHERIHGPLRGRPLGVLIMLAESVDLRGRGGAAFPFARKLRAVASSARSKGLGTVVVVNAAEGEPAAGKDKMLIQRVPHLVIDGAILTAEALKSSEIVIGVVDGGPQDEAIRTALAEREGRSEPPITVVAQPDRFISGEGGALVRGVNGELAIPPGRKVRASDVGVDGLPTMLSNAETFAQLAVLSRLGTDRYASAGTPNEPGTVLLTVGGSADSPAIIEAPTGVPLSAVLEMCGATTGQGVLLGGYHGKWITSSAAENALVSREDLDRVGGRLGAGVIQVLGEGVCPLGEVARIASYLANESSGQCGPCRLGLPALARSLTALVDGDAGEEALEAVRKGSRAVRGRGACHHPDGSVQFMLSAIDVFTEDIDAHLEAGSCERPVRGVLPLPGEDAAVRLSVDWSRCAGHGLCAHLVPDLISLDANGFPVLSDMAVPNWLTRDALQAVEMCPALALQLNSAGPV
jgi:NADH:ubiquinone oxidoreductase subunit F (NADH-binding)/ferredoxin